MNLSDEITERYLLKMELPAIHAEADAYENSLKPVTVRLQVDTIRTLDNISKFLNMSRQELNVQIIESGISEILISLAKASLHLRFKNYKDFDDEEYAKLLEAERLQFIRELCS